MFMTGVTAAPRAVPVTRMPASLGLLPLADVADGERRDGWPERVIRRKDAVISVPVLARRRHKVGEPVEKLKRRELDDAIGPRPGGLSAAARADPGGGLVSGQCVADATDAAACVAGHSQPLERERWPRAIPQQVLEAPKIARHITVDECDPHTRVYRKPAVLPGKHVGGRLGVEEARASEPADQAAADLLGDRGEIGRVDRAGRQERRGSVATCSVGRRHEDTVGDAGVQMHMAVEGGAEPSRQPLRRSRS